MKRTGFYRFTAIYKSSDFCSYCGSDLAEWEKVIDHFYPVSWWWGHSKKNLFVSCRECNAIKSNFIFESLSEARKYILPRKKQVPTVEEISPIEEVEPEISEIPLTYKDSYPDLYDLQKYHNCIYVLRIGNIDQQRKKLIRKYLLRPFLPLIEDDQLREILTESHQKELIIYRNSILC